MIDKWKEKYIFEISIISICTVLVGFSFVFRVKTDDHFNAFIMGSLVGAYIGIAIVLDLAKKAIFKILFISIYGGFAFSLIGFFSIYGFHFGFLFFGLIVGPVILFLKKRVRLE